MKLSSFITKIASFADSNINNAVNNAYQRASSLLDMSVPEVRVRSTITGGVEIGRLLGVVHLTLLAPMEKLADLGLKKFVQRQYSSG